MQIDAAIANRQSFPCRTDRTTFPSSTSFQYDTDDDGVVQEKLIDGELPYIDPRWKERSFAEGKLVELMERCWIYDPDERIGIFEAVEFLESAIEENEARRGRDGVK